MGATVCFFTHTAVGIEMNGLTSMGSNSVSFICVSFLEKGGKIIPLREDTTLEVLRSPWKTTGYHLIYSAL